MIMDTIVMDTIVMDTIIMDTKLLMWKQDKISNPILVKKCHDLCNKITETVLKAVGKAVETLHKLHTKTISLPSTASALSEYSF